MSLEAAIHDHAAALREVAAAVLTLAGDTESRLRKAEMMVGVHLQEAFEAERKLKELQESKGETPAASPDAELETSVAKVEADAKKEKAAGKSDAGSAKEVAAEPAPAADTVKAEATAPLDYNKDVMPKLGALMKAKGKPAIVELLAMFGAAKAQEVDAARYGELLAAADKMLAA